MNAYKALLFLYSLPHTFFLSFIIINTGTANCLSVIYKGDHNFCLWRAPFIETIDFEKKKRALLSGCGYCCAALWLSCCWWLSTDLCETYWLQCVSPPESLCPVLVIMWWWCPPLPWYQQMSARGVYWLLKDGTVADPGWWSIFVRFSASCSSINPVQKRP